MVKRIVAVLRATTADREGVMYRKFNGYTPDIKLAQKFLFLEHLYSHDMPQWTAIGYLIPLNEEE